MAKRGPKPTSDGLASPKVHPLANAGGKIFISWSGPVSMKVADALKGWLPEVIEGIEPWISTQDIEAGSRWGSEIGRQLERTNFGILCLTKENLEAPWVLFEAGALAKAVDSACVVPYLFDVSGADVKPPLGQFNHVPATRAGTHSLLRSLNTQSGSKYDESRLEKRLDTWWPQLEQALAAIPSGTAKTPHRKDRELIEELLELARRPARPDDEVRSLSTQVFRMMVLLQSPSYSSIFDSGYDLVDYIGLVPIEKAEKMGDGTLFAYWRSIQEYLEANEDSEDDDVIRENRYFRDVESDLYAEIQRRILKRLNWRGR